MTSGSSLGDRGRITSTLARFVSSSAPEDLPLDVLHEGKRSLLNGLAAGLAGAGEPDMRSLDRVMDRFAGPQRIAAVIGRQNRTDVLTAAFLNAARINILDFDDTHPTIVHPTAIVAATALAMADARRISGKDLLTAFAIGVEIECRLANAVSPGHYMRGWHITSTCGIFGAAAVAAKLSGLDATQTAWAFGHASAMSSGLVETLGSWSKSVGMGHGARGGFLAAILAREGLAGPHAPIEGHHGFLNVMADQPDEDTLLSGLGNSWELRKNTYKPYPCAVVLNPVIEACLSLHAKPDLAMEDIASIVVRGHPLLRQRTDRPSIASGRQAQVSAQHAVAVSLLTGRAGIPEFSDKQVADEATQSLRAKVTVEDDTSITAAGAALTVLFADGRTTEVSVIEAKGGRARPLGDAEIETKARELAALGSPSCNIEALIDTIWSLESVADVSTIMAHTQTTH